jgi:N-acetylglucosaminyl-diphospho-decaprenol L-rhamnosyltransferase
VHLKALVTVVTFNNSSSQLDLYARALMLSAQAAGDIGQVSLLYIDNGEPSNLSERVAAAEALPPTGNIGYGPALNRLLDHSFNQLKADVVVTSNPDGAFHCDCLRLLLSELQSDPLQLIEARQFPAEHPKHYDPTSGNTAWASGCCTAISHAVFDRIGNVDPIFWLYLEDVDYSWRARAHGIPVHLLHEALYAHEVSDGRDSEFVRRQMLLSGRSLARRWRNPRFERTCERLLIEELGIAAADLPSLDGVVPVSQEWTGVSDFSQRFSFARTRW